MKTAIWGSRKTGIKVKRLAEATPGRFDVLFFADNDKERIGCYVDGLRVIGIDELTALMTVGKIEAVIVAVSNPHVSSVTQQLFDNGIKDCYVLPYHYYKDSIDEMNLEDLIHIDSSKPRLEYYEYHISDHCNLNCKGCGHFCNLVSEESFGDLEQYEKDIWRLKELVWGVHRIRLMGGEPLLNPELKEFVTITRDVFPDATISVVTNGLLLDKIDDKLLRVMHDTHSIFDVTQYPPTSKKIDAIKAICELYEIIINTSPVVNNFFALMDLSGINDPEKSYPNCISKHCAYLRNGNISRCAMPQLVHLFNEQFGAHIDVKTEDVISIFDENLTGMELVGLLRSPSQMCRYCEEEPRVYPWEAVGHVTETSDWLG